MIPRGEFTEADNTEELLAGARDRMRTDIRFSRPQLPLHPMCSPRCCKLARPVHSRGEDQHGPWTPPVE